MSHLPEQTATQVWQQAGQPVPTDVKAIAASLGILVVPHKLDNSVSAILMIEGNGAIIGVNEDHPPVRQRFSIAHELGHWFLHQHSDSQIFVDATSIFFRDRKSAEGTALQEIEANRFAAELLMPASSLNITVAAYPDDAFDEDVLHSIADQYGVSLQALTIRLAKLNLISG